MPTFSSSGRLEPLDEAAKGGLGGGLGGGLCVAPLAFATRFLAFTPARCSCFSRFFDILIWCFEISTTGLAWEEQRSLHERGTCWQVARGKVRVRAAQDAGCYGADMSATTRAGGASPQLTDGDSGHVARPQSRRLAVAPHRASPCASSPPPRRSPACGHKPGGRPAA